MSRLNNRLSRPIVCCVTDRRAFPIFNSVEQQEALLSKIEAAAVAGVDWIQIREKDLSARKCGYLTREALRRVGSASADKTVSTCVLVNDRVDIAISERAGGVHLGERSLPVAEARRIVEGTGNQRDFLIGASCHSLEDAKLAANDGADYVSFGPIFETPSKAAFGQPQGLAALEGVCRAVSIPVLAIGGITLENSAACFAVGAAGIAAIRLFQDSTDLPAVVESLRKRGS